MKMRNKGKVYPSPSSSSSSSSSSSIMSSYTINNRDGLSVLKLLPAAIVALVAILSLQDKEVFAYMITNSMKFSNPSSIVEEKKISKKSTTHKSPLFDCDCFDCYISYWFRWDSSPNRELIHKAIEAFEEHLAIEEQLKKNTRGKKREKTGRRAGDKAAEVLGTPAEEREVDFKEVEDSFVVVLPDNDDVVLPEKKGVEEGEEEEVLEEAAAAAVLPSSAANNHKGLARKVLPDVVGLFNSRLWSLWSPNA